MHASRDFAIRSGVLNNPSLVGSSPMHCEFKCNGGIVCATRSAERLMTRHHERRSSCRLCTPLTECGTHPSLSQVSRRAQVYELLRISFPRCHQERGTRSPQCVRRFERNYSWNVVTPAGWRERRGGGSPRRPHPNRGVFEVVVTFEQRRRRGYEWVPPLLREGDCLEQIGLSTFFLSL